MFQAGAVKVKHDLLLVVLQVNQSKTSPLKKDDGWMLWHTPWHPRILRGAMHSGKKWRSALWLNAMHSGKKLWIREFELPSMYSFKILFIMLLARYARSAAIISSLEPSFVLLVALHTAGAREIWIDRSRFSRGENSSVLTSSWNQAAFVTGDGIKYPRKGTYNFKTKTSWKKWKVNHFVFLSFYFGAKNGSPATRS